MPLPLTERPAISRDLGLRSPLHPVAKITGEKPWDPRLRHATLQPRLVLDGLASLPNARGRGPCPFWARWSKGNSTADSRPARPALARPAETEISSTRPPPCGWGNAALPSPTCADSIGISNLAPGPYRFLRTFEYEEPEPDSMEAVGPRALTLSQATDTPQDLDFGRAVNFLYTPWGGR